METSRGITEYSYLHWREGEGEAEGEKKIFHLSFQKDILNRDILNRVIYQTTNFLPYWTFFEGVSVLFFAFFSLVCSEVL